MEMVVLMNEEVDQIVDMWYSGQAGGLEKELPKDLQTKCYTGNAIGNFSYIHFY